MNGWKNYQTWNMAMWLTSDEYLYGILRECHNWNMARTRLSRAGFWETGDGVAIVDRRISGREMSQLMKEIRHTKFS